MHHLHALIQIADFDGHMDWNGDWSAVMIVAMVVFWILVIAGIVWLVRELGSSRRADDGPGADPLKMLDQRLADGSISPDDYRERRAILTGRGQDPA